MIIEKTNIDEAIKSANAARLANKNQWIFLQIATPESTVLCKTYNTSIQILRNKDGLNYPSIWDATVREWKAAIRKALSDV